MRPEHYGNYLGKFIQTLLKKELKSLKEEFYDKAEQIISK